MANEEENPEGTAPPPPPPPPPEEPKSYEAEGYTPDTDAVEEEYGVNNAGPAVASSASKNLVLMLVGGALGIFLLYQIFSGGDEEIVATAPPPTGAGSQGAAVAAAEDSPIIAPVFNPLPAPPPVLAPPPVINELPTPPPPPDTPTMDFLGEGPDSAELEKRRSSEMLILNGGNNAAPEDEVDTTKSAAPRAVATHVGDLDQLVLQGKIIHGALETAIDTTLQGTLRAIVTRDIYAESGYGVLIPKGTRLIGVYDTGIVRGQGRVYVIWNRLIRPDGVDIELGDANGMDRLGRSGMTGAVDNRYFEIFGGAVLTSVLGIAIAGIADVLLDTPETSTTQSPEGASSQQGSPTATAVNESVENIGSAAATIVGGLLDARPSITVDQGTPIKIFVNQDLEFPDTVSQNIRIIQ